MSWSHSGWGRIDISDALGRPYPPLQSTPIYSDNNILQMVVWESFFFNQGIACLEMAQLWAVLVKCWLSSDCDFDGFSTSQIGWNGVAVTVQSHRRYGAIASPLRCNRDAVTVQSHRRYGVIATWLHRNGKHFWQKTDCRHCQRAEGYPFSALIAPVSKC